MELRLDLALKYADTHFGKKLSYQDLAIAMFPDSKFPYQSLYNLRKDITKKFSCAQLEAIVRLTGIPIQMLLQ